MYGDLPFYKKPEPICGLTKEKIEEVITNLNSMMKRRSVSTLVSVTPKPADAALKEDTEKNKKEVSKEKVQEIRPTGN